MWKFTGLEIGVSAIRNLTLCKHGMLGISSQYELHAAFSASDERVCEEARQLQIIHLAQRNEPFGSSVPNGLRYL